MISATHIQVTTTEAPFLNPEDWTRLGARGPFVFYQAGAGGGYVVLRVPGAHANLIEEHFVPPAGRVTVEHLLQDEHRNACRVSLPVAEDNGR